MVTNTTAVIAIPANRDVDELGAHGERGNHRHRASEAAIGLAFRDATGIMTQIKDRRPEGAYLSIAG